MTDKKDTLTDNPFAKFIDRRLDELRKDLCDRMTDAEGRIAAHVVAALMPRLNHLELAQRATEGRAQVQDETIATLRRDLDALAARVDRYLREASDTLPPPSLDLPPAT